MRIFYGNEANDGVGNRKTSKELKIPYDGIGNVLEEPHVSFYAADNIGNSIDAAPTHHLSGLYRKKGDQMPLQRTGRYMIGGVNPVVVAGLSHLVPEKLVQAEPVIKKSEFDEEDQMTYTLSSTPEEKLLQTERSLRRIFELGGAPVELEGTILDSPERPVLAVVAKSTLFKSPELEASAFGFLVNKIVNRLPGDRIRLAIRFE